jgi:hypothetical protein
LTLELEYDHGAPVHARDLFSSQTSFPLDVRSSRKSQKWRK